MSMITATAWVPRGFAAPFPTKYTFDEEEFQRIADLAKLQLDDANEDLEEARTQATAGNGDAAAEEEGSDDEAGATTLKSKGYVGLNFIRFVANTRHIGTRMTISKSMT